MLTPRPIHGAALLLSAVLSCASLAVAACSALTPTEQAALRSATPAIIAIDDWACSETSLIQVVGPLVDAVACPAWEAEVAAELAKLTTAPAASAKVKTAKGTVGKLVPKGTAPAALAAKADAGAAK